MGRPIIKPNVGERWVHVNAKHPKWRLGINVSITTALLTAHACTKFGNHNESGSGGSLAKSRAEAAKVSKKGSGLHILQVIPQGSDARIPTTKIGDKSYIAAQALADALEDSPQAAKGDQPEEVTIDPTCNPNLHQLDTGSNAAINVQQLEELEKPNLGIKYKFDTGPFQQTGLFDCSSFIQYLFRKQLGDSQMIHSSPEPEDGVQITDINQPYWQKTFMKSTRITRSDAI